MLDVCSSSSSSSELQSLDGSLVVRADPSAGGVYSQSTPVAWNMKTRLNHSC
jgi:hypothetical protein